MIDLEKKPLSDPLQTEAAPLTRQMLTQATRPCMHSSAPNAKETYRLALFLFIVQLRSEEAACTLSDPT